MVFNAAFNNISAILWQSVLLVEETRVHGPVQVTGTCHVTHEFLGYMSAPISKSAQGP